MPRYRNRLPQLDGAHLLTDSGLETYLIFHEGVDLPAFASFPLLDTPGGRARLAAYYRRHMAIAADHGLGFLLESPTWRASRAWAADTGHDLDDLRRLNHTAIAFLADLRGEAGGSGPLVISGNLGPRGDGYQPDRALSATEAAEYHAEQIGWFAETDADMVSAFTLSTAAEAIGIVNAAAAAGLPSAISFTVETDGNLPDGTPLGSAIEETDARTGGAAAYMMVNCAHPDHFRTAVAAGQGWTGRIRGIRANASRMSHAELDQAECLDEGNPAELGAAYADLTGLLPNLRVVGGCCGTDHRHVAAIAAACRPPIPAGANR